MSTYSACYALPIVSPNDFPLRYLLHNSEWQFTSLPFNDPHMRNQPASTKVKARPEWILSSAPKLCALSAIQLLRIKTCTSHALNFAHSERPFNEKYTFLCFNTPISTLAIQILSYVVALKPLAKSLALFDLYFA